MIKHKKIIICILLSYALFIVGIFNVKAESVSINLNNSYPKFTYGSSEYNATWNWPNYNGIMYYQWSVGGFPLGNNLVGLNVTNIRFNGSIQGYDYALVHTYTMGSINYNFNNLIINDVCGSPVYGYSINNQLMEKDISNNNISDLNSYSTTFYIDLSSLPSNCVSDYTSWRFMGNSSITYNNSTSPNGTIYFGLSSVAYLGKKGDSTYQQIEQNTNNINNSVNQVNDSINDSSIDTNNTSSSTSSWGNKNATNGTITDLLTLPISLLQAIVNGISSSCSSFSLGSLFGTNITLPCINIGSLVGSSLWSTIDILFSGFMILAIAKKLIKIFNDFTNLKTNQVDELYGGGK